MEFIADLIAAPFVCIGWIILGAIAGALANTIMKSNQPIIVDIITGWIGAFIGGLLVSLLGLYRPTAGLSGYLASLVVATVGAIILIAIVRAIRGQRIA